MKAKQSGAVQPKRIGKKQLWIIAGAAALAVVLIVLCLLFAFGRGNTLLTVNGIAVGEDEMTYYLQKNRADVITRYTAGEGLPYDEAFWTAQVEGTTPLEDWIQTSLEECIYENVVRQLAKEEGLTESVTYAEWLADLKRENDRRAQAVKNNEIIYGPQSYDTASYFQLTLANLLEDMQDIFSASYTPGDTDMNAYYEENKELFKEQDIREIRQISIAYGEGAALDQELAEQKANEIHDALRKGEEVSSVIKRYLDCAELTDKEYDRGRGDQSDVRLMPQTYANAVALNAGEISGITNENNAYYISICTELFPGDYQSFEDSKPYLSEQLTGQAFDAYIEGQVAQANVETDDGALTRTAQALNR